MVLTYRLRHLHRAASDSAHHHIAALTAATVNCQAMGDNPSEESVPPPMEIEAKVTEEDDDVTVGLREMTRLV